MQVTAGIYREIIVLDIPALPTNLWNCLIERYLEKVKKTPQAQPHAYMSVL
ncbi:hypothetical protein [Moorena producens]|uniref:hypothetical protein n=1 Tax=Moorena producens TaxID=1155739 RepID=UPI001314593D|nr:hypothetical protein [Moorena producens]